MPTPAYIKSLGSPAGSALSITSGYLGAALSSSTSWLYIGASGDLNVDLVGTANITFAGLAAGTLLPICVTQVNTWSGTDGAVIALW
jgi:hypothetical protein